MASSRVKRVTVAANRRIKDLRGKSCWPKGGAAFQRMSNRKPHIGIGLAISRMGPLFCTVEQRYSVLSHGRKPKKEKADTAGALPRLLHWFSEIVWVPGPERTLQRGPLLPAWQVLSHAPAWLDVRDIMTTTLGVKAYEKLRGMLVHGRLQPGMQLVNRKLADEIGMSMTPVREAVTRLASEGLVEYVPGAGAFVRRISRQELGQLYDVRLALESLAAAEAAQHASNAEIAELRAVAADSFAIIRAIGATPAGHATAEQMARWIEDEQRFHDLLFQAARNPWLSKVATDLKLLAHCFSAHRRIPAFLTVATAVRTWRDHRRLIRALATRDLALATATIGAHVAEGKREVFAHLTADGDFRAPPETNARRAAPRRAKHAAAAEGTGRNGGRPAVRRVAGGTATRAGRPRSRG